MKHNLLLIVFCLFITARTQAQNDSTMYVHYINVGQGNAALLEFSCGAVLIDAGAQDIATTRHLVKYLKAFFARRTDLDNTLDLVMITHCHKDHNEALKQVANNFTIKRYIDNGLIKGSGKINQVWMQKKTETSDIQYGTYSFETITARGNKKGLTNKTIDPIKCGSVDPKIILYSGSFDEKPDSWSNDDFVKNGNNHSLFIKVIFGKASFLFIGDGEIAEMNTVTDYYNGTKALDADILLVGHHGAKNATTYDFLDAVTPKYAIISCGLWYDSTTSGRFNTYHYGHPTDSAIRMITPYIKGNRSPILDSVMLGRGAKDFFKTEMKKRIYATPWDGDIVIRAKYNGKYQTTRLTFE